MLVPLIGLGWTEVLVVAGVIFVFFGASRIPAAFRSLGEGLNSFKEGLEGKKDDADEEKALPEKATSSNAGEVASKT